jgi:hypothetical protein
MKKANPIRLMLGTAALVSVMYLAGVAAGTLATDETACRGLEPPFLNHWCGQLQQGLGLQPAPVTSPPLVPQLMPDDEASNEPPPAIARDTDVDMEMSKDQMKDFERAVANRAVDLIMGLIVHAHEHPDEPLTTGMREALSTLFEPRGETH